MANERILEVLVVEDSSFQSGMIIDMLHSKGFTTEHATSLSLAIEVLDQQEVDAILLDLCLTDSYGIDTLVKVMEAAMGTPIVVLTGHDSVELGVRAVQAGAFDYLTKTKLEAAQLERAIQRAVQRASEAVEEDMRKKLEGVIEMAGAVAHEINQPLQTCLGYLELVQGMIKDNPEVTRRLGIAVDELNKASKITRRLNRVTRYRTRKYLDGNIIDIEEAAPRTNEIKFPNSTKEPRNNKSG